MMLDKDYFKSRMPDLDFSEGPEMLTDFSQESQRLLISARNSLLVLETVPKDMESIENIFKTFHTISGLADFLSLNDIYWVTKKSEEMINLIRKRKVDFVGKITGLTQLSLKRLQELFELLDEQIENRGKLGGEYPDQGELVARLASVVADFSDENAPLDLTKTLYQDTAISEISIEPENDFCEQLKEKIHNTKGNIILRKEPLERLLGDFKRLGDELRQAQAKVQERQKELIKERELALKLTQKAQDEARAKSDYLANMSHEIRTLINAILGFTDIIKEDLPENSRQIDHLNTIIISGKMLLEIVNNILDFAKVEAGKLKLEEIPFNLSEIINNVFQIVRAKLQSKPINLYIDFDSNVPVGLMGDPTRLKQLFINLLDNAVKFTEHGEIGVRLRLARQQGKSNNPAIHFTVKDTGIGIPEDRKNLIFDSYTQAEASTTRLYGGTGLGLALCRSLVEAMNGSIWADSELGAGTEFNFVIQFQKAGDDQITAPAIPEYTGSEKILVVTPYEKTGKMFQVIFDHLSVTPLSICRNIKHAQEILTSLNRSPDIIFVDALFPGSQAVDFAKEVRKNDIFKHCKVVVISSDITCLERQPQYGEVFSHVVFTPLILTEFIALLGALSGQSPKKNGDTKSEVDAALVQKEEAELFKGAKLLVVEDSVPNQELLRVHFEDLGCICDYASNGKEAIEFFQRASYDLCFMDLQMPVMGGLEATRFIRNELKSEVPIIALTAAEVQDERTKCLEMGMSDYLAKPFDFEQLKEKLVKFVKR